MKTHNSVAIVIFNKTTHKFVFVKQFRPAVFMNRATVITGKTINSGDKVDTNAVKGEEGITMELCAGIIDKNISLEEIAREEGGYVVPVEKLKKIIEFPSGVGSSGGTQTL